MKRPLVELVGVIGLAASVVASGIWIVEVEHRSRQLFIETEALNRRLDELQIEWGQLQIEQSTLALTRASRRWPGNACFSRSRATTSSSS